MWDSECTRVRNFEPSLAVLARESPDTHRGVEVGGRAQQPGFDVTNNHDISLSRFRVCSDDLLTIRCVSGLQQRSANWPRIFQTFIADDIYSKVNPQFPTAKNTRWNSLRSSRACSRKVANNWFNRNPLILLRTGRSSFLLVQEFTSSSINWNSVQTNEGFYVNGILPSD